MANVKRKLPLVGLSLVRYFWTVSQRVPAIVRHPMFIPSTLVSFFHCLDILMKPFTLIFTLISKIVRKSANMAKEKVNFYAHIGSKFSK